MLDNMLVILSQMDKEEQERQFKKAAMLNKFSSAEVTKANAPLTQIIPRILHIFRRRDRAATAPTSVLADAREHR